MPTIEQVFLDTKAIFTAQAKDAMDEAMDKLYSEYLPHVENDTVSNVHFQTYRWLEAFFADSLTGDDMKLDITSKYCGKAARAKMFSEHREEFVQALGRDFEAEIEGLKEQLNAARRGY
jgi:hypothetical protein